jgi:hypothetical protein
LRLNGFIFRYQESHNFCFLCMDIQQNITHF